MRNSVIDGQYILVIVGMVVAGMVLCGTESVQAANVLNSCTTYCHGMPPRDGVRKASPHFDSMSSSFTGNHQTHVKASPAATDCGICHINVSPTNFGHSNGVIGMANSLKRYSSATLRAKYDKGVFFNQTSIPLLTNARCSNASCHFEKQTPIWGSALFTAPADCAACHGVPPDGSSAAPAGGLAGSHARHDAYFPGTGNCQKCHPAHTTFLHATSAGRPLKVQGFLRDPLNTLETGASYSGTGVNYLPSKSGAQAFGICNNLYCHSSGQSATGAGAGTGVTVPTWGGSVTGCGSCHQNMGPAVNAAATGKHATHAQKAGISCSVCHGSGYAATSVPTGTGTTHVDKNINLSWTGLAATPVTVYSKTNTFLAGSAVYGSCSNSYCHSTVQNATTGTASGVTYRSVSWASATTLTCAGCHVNMATDTTGTGSHRVHTISTGANFDCAVCHLGYTRTTSAVTTHANGLVDLGATGLSYSQGAAHPAANGYGTCSVSTCHGSGIVPWGGTLWSSTDQCGKCHGSSTAGAITATAPFYGTSFPNKITANTDAKVGAHTSHLTGTDSLAATLICSDCHGSVSLTGITHMNGTVNFVWNTLATKGGALTPTYSAATGVCTNVYCHGASMTGGDTSGTNRAPTWNVPFLPATLSAAACGTCHGFPPSTASGHPAVVIPAGFPTTAAIGTTCSCHANINTAGNSYGTIFVNKALHINGITEVIAGGTCDACHGYPPASSGFAGTQGNWTSARLENYPGGGGAHTIDDHVSKLAKPGDGFAGCSKCHDSADHQVTPIVFNPSQNIKVRVNQHYRYEAAKQFKYTSNRLDAASHLTGNCSNASCHFGATPKWDPAR